MKLIHSQLHTYIESVTGLPAFFMHIPTEESLPAIAYKNTLMQRFDGSNQNETNVVEHNYLLALVDVDNQAERLMNNAQLIIDSFHETTFDMDEVTVLNSEVISVTDVENQEQDIYVQEIQIQIIVEE